MQPSAAIVVRPAVDFDLLIRLSHEMLGYSISSTVDGSRIERSNTYRLLSCLAALRDSRAPAGITPNLLNAATYSILIAADERDLLDILEAIGGMSFVMAETVQRGVCEAVLTGTLAEWRDAVKSGASQTVERNVRAFFCKIMSMFEAEGLDEMWKDFSVKPLNDHTFYLEDKRR